MEVKARSYDGTPCRLSIVYPKGMKMDGSHPTLLEGYGAYGTSRYPSFSATRLAWHEKGGVIGDLPCARWRGVWRGVAPGRKGEDEAEYMARFHRLRAISDRQQIHFSGAAGRSGASAGGILIGRAITERPDLFGVAIIDVGALDMLRLETTATAKPTFLNSAARRLRRALRRCTK